MGRKLTLADVQLFTAMDLLSPEQAQKGLATHPKVKSIVDYVAALPAVAKWLSERKATFL